MPVRALGHRGAHPLAALNFVLRIRCERASNAMLSPPMADSHAGMRRGGRAPAAAAHA